MSDGKEKPDLKLLKFEPPSSGDPPTNNEWAAKALRDMADQLAEVDNMEVGSIGIAITFQNGVTLSTWKGTYPILLVGALANLQRQVLEEGLSDD